jgi:BON domain
MRKRVFGAALLTVGVVTAVVLIRTFTRPSRALRRGFDVVGRRLRYARGRLDGARYRLARRTPDPDVGDDVLADRIRSCLGPLEKRLDVPRVHVMVEDHVAVLHGEVADERDAEAIERAVRDVSGVRGTESHLHVGLGAGNTRPSEGRARALLH